MSCEEVRTTLRFDRAEPRQAADAGTRPALLGCASSPTPGETPKDRAVGLVLIGLRAGLAADLRWSMDGRDSLAEAISVARDLVRKLEVDDDYCDGTATGCSRPEAAPPSAPDLDESIREPGAGWHTLTEMERLVARLIADGYTNEQAARKLSRSKHTIGTHLRSAFVKMQVQSRVQLANAVAGRDDRQPGRQLAG